MPESDKISIVTIGVHRSTAEAVQNLFEDTPYELVAILDTTESPKPYRYSPQNLGVTLHALFPRPRALVTGNAVGALLPEIDPVWEEYVNGTGVDGIWVALSKTHPNDGPPPPGTEEELMKQLDEKFRPGTMSEVREDALPR